MAGQWMAFATTQTVALIDASNQPLAPLGPHFHAATEALQGRTGNLRRLNRGEAILWEGFNMTGPNTLLREASRAVALYTDLHNRVVRVFSMYGQTIGVLTDGPLWQTDLAAGPQAASQLWQTWVHWRALALHTPHQVSQSLRAVAAYNLATFDAVFVARCCPINSASRTAWMRAAENLAGRADGAAQAAWQSQSTMRTAVSRSSGSASAILIG